MTPPMGPERERLRATCEQREPWYRWGSYLSERQWGTVREDYSANGDAWNYFPHDMARSRAYRWGEDGLLGLCDESGSLCFAPVLWNGVDPILKERLFGLSNGQGNHGEDVKESYFYLDNTPTHSYMKALYKYPQRCFPYDDLVQTNAERSRLQPEYEILDTGVFDEDRYFDVEVEYAKAGPEDICIRITATNRGPDAADLHLLPTLWFRNTWSWGRETCKPLLRRSSSPHGSAVVADHNELGRYTMVCADSPSLLFTENETNLQLLDNATNPSPYAKDGIHRAVVNGATDTVNPNQGTKVAAHYVLSLAPGATSSITLRLTAGDNVPALDDVETIFARRRAEADEFFEPLIADLPATEGSIVRQALAGILWNKQYYNYDVRAWLQGDPAAPPPPERWNGRNHEWQTLKNNEVLSMPDAWEYPWYASWDLSFHTVSLALVDPYFAKNQLILLTREWYMKPDGQIPAYEWAFSQVNPPVQAWAAWKVYSIERQRTGTGDRAFLERIFQKLLLNFTWWVNRKDPMGHNVFEAGFLGLDNIGAFDRDAPLPTGGYLRQSDATAWMGMYCLNMLAIAMELAVENPIYEDVATKFFEHFLHIAGALNDVDGDGRGLWDEQDRFFYDVVGLPNGDTLPLRVRSLVGLLPLCAVLTISPEQLDRLPDFRRRLDSFLDARPDLAALVSTWNVPGQGNSHLLALTHGDRLRDLLVRMLDPEEFLSDHGIRSLSRYHLDHPYVLDANGTQYSVSYVSGPSNTGLFGGNSNWRGPVWFPTNYLLIDALRSFDRYYNGDFLVEHPAGSGRLLSLRQIADDLACRLAGIFLPGRDGRRPVYGDNEVMQSAPHWCDYTLFYEYFDGDTGQGLGASHQTGWTALAVNLLLELSSTRSNTSSQVEEAFLRPPSALDTPALPYR